MSALNQIRGKISGVILTIFLLCSNSESLAEKPTYFERIDQSEDSSSYINKLVQRKDGFVWIATSEGISRFDGYSFNNYLSDPNDPTSIPSSWVETMFEDSRERLWVGTDRGLARLTANEREFSVYQNDPKDLSSLSGHLVSEIIEDKQGRIWVATNLGLNLYRENTKDFQTIAIPSSVTNGTGDNAIHFMAFDAELGLWLGTDQGLYQFDIESKTFSKEQKVSELGNAFLDGAFDQSGNLWLATQERGVIKYHPKTMEIANFRSIAQDPSTIASDYCWNIFVDRDGVVWAGTRGTGLNSIQPETNVVQRFQYNLANQRTIPSNLVTDVMQDESGMIWIGTYDGIALFQPSQTVENIRPIPYDKNSLSSDLAWSFAETDNAIWIGTTEGLNREDKKTGLIKSYNTEQYGVNSHNFNAIWAIKTAGNQRLWLATEFGLATFEDRLDKIEYTYSRPNIASLSVEDERVLKSSVWAIHNNPDDSVWAGTNDGQLYRYSLSRGIITNHTAMIRKELKSKSRLEYNNIIQDNNNNLWLSTSSGLYHINTEEGQIKEVLDEQGNNLFPEDWIYATQHFRDDLYWVSTQRYGLFLLKFNSNGSITKIKNINQETPDIADKNFYNIYPVSNTHLWFSGKRNLYELNLDTWKVTNYGSDIFLPKIVFHENTQFLDSRENLYFGSTKGVIRFSPQELRAVESKKASYVPNVYITDIETNSLTIENKQNLIADDNRISKKQITVPIALHKLEDFEFSHEQNMFHFKFTALNYSNTSNIKYAYRLRGFEESWSQYSSRREITYTNLPAGEYALQVKATTGVRDWSERQANLNFVVLESPWKTQVAYLSYSLIFLLIFSIIYRFWRKQLLTQYALNQSEVRLKQALWGSGDELWEWDIQQGDIRRQNCFEDFESIDTLDSRELMNLKDQVHRDDFVQLEQKLRNVIEGKNSTLEAVYRRKDKNGKWVWLLERAKVTELSDNKMPLRLSGTTRNVTNLKQAEEKNRLLASAFQSTTDGAMLLDIELEIISINDAFTKITGFDKSIINTAINPIFISSGRTLSDGAVLCSEIMKNILKNHSFNDELWIRKSNGKKIPVDLRMATVDNSGGEITHFIITLTDINYRKKAEKELRKLADFDSLTGLPNRARLMRQLEYGILQVERDTTHLAVMFIDLDNFKNVNDSLGHSSGDALLIAVAQRLKQCVRRTDTVARLGGDEFTIGLLGVEHIDDVTKVALNILEAMRKSFFVEEHELVISPSIGIAIYGEDGKDVDTLLRHADIAMYHAKTNGRNNFEYFTQSMNERVYNRIALEKRVRRALAKNEFVLYYQPKFSLLGGHIIGFEALVRWQDPELGILTPNEFIPIAEETGLILPLGSWVINAACAQLNLWNQAGFDTLNLAVNLSALQFRDKNLMETVQNALQTNGITASYFELEITESALIDNMQYTIKTLNELRDLGVKLSLDDFGTGYSSLNYLKKFPIQSLKIDRSFVRDITSDKRDAKMVASIVALAHNLDIRVIGEGIEDREQLVMLSQFGVDEGQGFLLGYPVNAEEASFLLQKSQNISSILKPVNIK